MTIKPIQTSATLLYQCHSLVPTPHDMKGGDLYPAAGSKFCSILLRNLADWPDGHQHIKQLDT